MARAAAGRSAAASGHGGGGHPDGGHAVDHPHAAAQAPRRWGSLSTLHYRGFSPSQWDTCARETASKVTWRWYLSG